MSAQFRSEHAKMVDKYGRTFGILVSQVAHGTRPGGEAFIWCPERPELPAWGMGNNSEDWEDGPRKQQPIASRRKR